MYVGTIFFYLYLPETKGKTLQEIEDFFAGRTKSLQNKSKKNFNKNLEKEPASLLHTSAKDIYLQ